MAVLKAKEVAKMNGAARKEKVKDLKMELVRANVTANKANAKTKEIKKAISRLMTAMNQEKKLNKTTAPKAGKELKK